MRAATRADQRAQQEFCGRLNSSECILRRGFTTAMLVQDAETGGAL
jgi:hypothetical protein